MKKGNVPLFSVNITALVSRRAQKSKISGPQKSAATFFGEKGCEKVAAPQKRLRHGISESREKGEYSPFFCEYYSLVPAQLLAGTRL